MLNPIVASCCFVCTLSMLVAAVSSYPNIAAAITFSGFAIGYAGLTVLYS